MSKIKLIAFDLDGTLIDTRGFHESAFLRAVKKIVDVDITHDDHESLYDGLTTKGKIDRLFEIDNSLNKLPEDVKIEKKKEIELQKQAIVKAEIEAWAKERESVISRRDLFQKLKRAGCQVRVVTNCQKDTADIIQPFVDPEGIAGEFIAVSGDVPPKPHPCLYLMAMVDAKVSPDETLVVEDSEYGAKAAQASGAWLYRVDPRHAMNCDVYFFNVMKTALSVRDIKAKTTS